MISIKSDLKTSKTIFNTKWYDVSIKGLNALKTSWNMNRFIIDIIFIPLELTGGCNVRPFIQQAILMHYRDDTTLLGMYLLN